MSEQEVSQAAKGRLLKDLELLTHDHALGVLKERPELLSHTVKVCVSHLDIITHNPSLADIMEAPGVPQDARPLLALPIIDCNACFLIASKSFAVAKKGQFGETWLFQVSSGDEGPQASFVSVDRS